MASISGIVSKNLDTTNYNLSLKDTSKSNACFQTDTAFIAHESAHLYQHQELIVAFVGHPYWQENNPTNKLAEPLIRQKVIDDYYENGSNVLNHIKGHFALAVINTANGNCLLATDRIGAHRLYWHQTATGDLVFSSSLRHIKALCKSDFKVSSNAIYSYMYFHMVPTPLSIYENIQKLPPAQTLSFDEISVTLTPFWIPNFVEEDSNNEQDLSEQLLVTIEESVASALATENKSAAFLSGGIDSSTVVGMMSRLQTEATNSYCIGFDAEQYDETPFARITAEHFGAKLHEHSVTPDDVVNIVPKIAQTYEEPFGNSSAVPSYYCAKFANNDGVKTMLAGDGGDELFAGNERYAAQDYYQYYLTLPATLRKHVFDPIFLNLPSWLPLSSKIKSYVSQANIPLPERLQVYNFLHRHPPEELFTTDFLKAVDTQLPIELQKQQYQKPDNASPLHRMLYLDWQFTLADNDLRKVSTMCELAGINVEYPLLSDELLELSVKVPPTLKLRDRKLRYFFKKAMQGFLNDKTLNKSKHGFGLPFGVWLSDYEPLNKLAYDSLESLKKRELFNPEFITKAIHMHSNEHAAYYGELIWIMMMLELWLQKNIDEQNV